MVNYGYDQNTPKWKGSRKKMLAIFLSRVLKYPIGYTGNGKPYIEIDELYSGGTHTKDHRFNRNRT